MLLRIFMTLFVAQGAIAAQVRNILKSAKPAGSVSADALCSYVSNLPSSALSMLADLSSAHQAASSARAHGSGHGGKENSADPNNPGVMHGSRSAGMTPAGLPQQHGKVSAQSSHAPPLYSMTPNGTGPRNVPPLKGASVASSFACMTPSGDYPEPRQLDFLGMTPGMNLEAPKDSHGDGSRPKHRGYGVPILPVSSESVVYQELNDSDDDNVEIVSSTVTSTRGHEGAYSGPGSGMIGQSDSFSASDQEYDSELVAELFAEGPSMARSRKRVAERVGDLAPLLANEDERSRRAKSSDQQLLHRAAIENMQQPSSNDLGFTRGYGGSSELWMPCYTNMFVSCMQLLY
jgi:hypothetical protein